MTQRVLFLVVACLMCLGCDEAGWSPAELGRGEAPQERRQLELGRSVYATYCVGCHGENGDGVGAAARFLEPKPRDFRMGMLKFASVAAGDFPRDEDYLSVIKHGLHGTAMPGFALLSDEELEAVVAYIRTFIDPINRDAPGASIQFGKDPWVDEPAGGLEVGRRAYHVFAKCWSCHPAYETTAEIGRFHVEAGQPVPELRPNMFESEMKDSQWGAPIMAPDFLADRVKTGLGLESLARVIGVGIGGTAMPTWAGALTDEQLWGIAHYVQSLSVRRGTEATAYKARLLAAEAGGD